MFLIVYVLLCLCTMCNLYGGDLIAQNECQDERDSDILVIEFGNISEKCATVHSYQALWGSKWLDEYKGTNNENAEKLILVLWNKAKWDYLVRKDRTPCGAIAISLKKIFGDIDTLNEFIEQQPEICQN